MRVTQLDELPQLFNVLGGDMSVVGPRPIRPVFFEKLCEDIPAYWQRLVLRPGLTGFAQVRMGREETWAEKLAHDLEYIADRSVKLYLSVIATTVWLIVMRPANRRATPNESAPDAGYGPSVSNTRSSATSAACGAASANANGASFAATATARRAVSPRAQTSIS